MEELSGTVVVKGGASINRTLTASSLANSTAALIKSGAGKLDGIVINSHTTGSVAIYDGLTSAGSLMHSTISFASGERSIPFFGEIFGTGLYVSLGGTAAISIMYR